MNIGLSCSVLQRGKSGVGQYILALVRALQARGGHRLSLFVLEEDVAFFDFTGPGTEIVEVPEFFRAPVKNILWHQTLLPAWARRQRLDVLHVPSYRRMLWRHPCPLVATIHDLAPFRVTGKYDWPRMFYGRVLARRLAGRQDQIIAVSHNTAADLRRFFGVPESRITVVHNGLDHERFQPGPREVARAGVEQAHGVSRPYFLYVARLEHPAKNHVRLIAAFEKFKQATRSDWQLVLAGGDWHGAQAIYAAIKASQFAADIRSLGFVRDVGLPELYRAAEVLIYPSLYEGFGLPPIEAMACGCPVICSANGSLGEIVGNAAVIVNPEVVDSMAEQLTVLAGDAGMRERLQAAGLARAREFNWEKTAAETLEVYAEVVRRAGAFAKSGTNVAVSK